MNISDRLVIGSGTKLARRRVLFVLLCLWAGLFAAQSVQAATLLTPLACISNIRTVLVDGKYLHTHVDAHLGYINTSTATIDIPWGNDNWFVPNSHYTGQIGKFFPGRHDNVLTLDLDMTTAPIRTWILDGSNDGVPGGGIQLKIKNDPADYCAPTVSSLSPANSPRGQTVTLNMTGTGFVSSLNVELTQGSVSLPVSVTSVDYSTMTASLAIPVGTPKGFYDLRVWRSGDTPVILPDAFQVMDSASAVKALLRLSPGVLLTGTAGAGVYKSVDGGAHWTQTNTGLTNLDITAFAAAADGSAVYVGTLTAGVFKSTNGGVTWVLASTGIDPHIHSLLASPDNPLALFAGTDKGVYKTIDGGLHWQTISNGLP